MQLFLRRFYSNEQRSAVIIGAVRSPFINEENVSKIQLATCIIDEVIKRAALPKAEICEVQVVGLNGEDVEKLKKSCVQIDKNVNLITANKASATFSNAMQKLNYTKSKAVVLCGVESIVIHNDSLKDSGDFESNEIMPLFNRTKRCMIKKDELTEKNKPVSVATAIALTKPNHAANLKINPMANLLHIDCDINCNAKSDIIDVIKTALGTQNFEKDHIDRWELLFRKECLDKLKLAFNLEVSKVNNYKLANILQEMPSIACNVLVTHLANNMKPTQTGCVGIADDDQLISLMFLKKFSYHTIGKSPILQLYTKDCCPLCDELIEDLEQNFKDEYQLEKIYIDRKENVQLLRLYRHDIPVLFLNGQFVCMHQLDKNVLRRMLTE